MERSHRGNLIRLRRTLMHGRRAVAATREELIQQLGDWLCGSGTAPCMKDIQALAELCDACERAEFQYAACLAALAEETVARAQRR